jgi:hypothetical protein
LIRKANVEQDSMLKRIWMNSAADRMIKTDPLAALDWSSNLPADVRWNVQAKIAAQISKSDLETGTKTALAIAAPSAKEFALVGIRNDLLIKNPKDAAQWLTSLPTDCQEHLVSGLVTNWYMIDSIEASEWVEALPKGLTRDRAVMFLATKLAETDVATARKTAEAIGDLQLRTSTLNRLRSR